MQSRWLTPHHQNNLCASRIHHYPFPFLPPLDPYEINSDCPEAPPHPALSMTHCMVKSNGFPGRG